MGVDRDGGLGVHRHMLCLCLYSCWRLIHYVCSYKSVHVFFWSYEFKCVCACDEYA